MGCRTCIILLCFAALAACDTGDGSVTVGTAAFPHTKGAAASDSLTGPARLNPPQTFMTSPHWLPDGSGVIASGYKGIGIFLLKIGEPEPITIHSTYAGALEWAADGKALCLTGPGSLGAFEYNGAAGTLSASQNGDRLCPLESEKYLERVVFESADMRVFHDGLYGGLRIEDAGVETTVEPAGAWGVAVSPDGSRIAYCLGRLASPSLFIHDRAGGKTSVGHGAHPSWFPGGRFLVYALPEAEENDFGGRSIVRSELALLDALNGTSERLTDTPDVTEMQPVVSPGGSAVVYSDWRTGAITAMPVGKDVQP